MSERLKDFCERNNVTVNEDGIIRPRLTHYQYVSMIFLSSSLLLLIGILINLQQHRYSKILIIIYSTYGLAISRYLGVDHYACTGKRIVPHYITDRGLNVPVEGGYEEIDIIDENLSLAELDILKKHTGIEDIDNIDLSDCNGLVERFPIPIKISKLPKAKLFQVSTDKGSFLTSTIITDKPFPLMNGEVVIGNRSNFPGIVDVSELYRMDENILIDIGEDQEYESTMYGLKEPRRFSKDGIVIIHPFHLPYISNILMSLVVVARRITS